MNLFIDRFQKISELEKEIEYRPDMPLTEDIGSGDISAALMHQTDYLLKPSLSLALRVFFVVLLGWRRL